MLDFVWADYAILGLVALSAIMSFVRGLIKESLSLMTWAFAFVISSRFYTDLSVYLTKIDDPVFRNGIAIVILFISTLILGALLNYILGQLVDKTGLSGTDRVLGLCFGAVRGTLVVAALLFALDTFTPASSTNWWVQSQLIPEFGMVVHWFFDSIEHYSSFLNPSV